MRASDLMFAKAIENGIIHVEGLSNNKLELVASNLQNSSTIRDSFVAFETSFTLSVKRGQKGLAAVNVRRTFYGKRSETENFSYMLAVSWPEGSPTPVIDLHDQWTPADPARLGGMKNLDLEVNIGGTTFTTNRHASGKKIIQDGNILCQYLAGDISGEEVFLAAGMEPDDRARFSEIRRLNQEVKILTQTADAAWEELTAARVEVTTVNEQLQIADRSLSSLVRKCDALWEGLRNGLGADFQMDIENMEIDLVPLWAQYRAEALKQSEEKSRLASRIEALRLAIEYLDRAMITRWFRRRKKLPEAARRVIRVARGLNVL